MKECHVCFHCIVSLWTTVLFTLSRTPDKGHFCVFDETNLLKNACYTHFMRQENNRRMRVYASVKKLRCFSPALRSPHGEKTFKSTNNPNKLTSYLKRLS